MRKHGLELIFRFAILSSSVFGPAVAIGAEPTPLPAHFEDGNSKSGVHFFGRGKKVFSGEGVIAKRGENLSVEIGVGFRINDDFFFHAGEGAEPIAHVAQGWTVKNAKGEEVYEYGRRGAIGSQGRSYIFHVGDKERPERLKEKKGFFGDSIYVAKVSVPIAAASKLTDLKQIDVPLNFNVKIFDTGAQAFRTLSVTKSIKVTFADP